MAAGAHGEDRVPGGGGFQLVGVQVVLCGQPLGGGDGLGNLAAPGQLGAVVGMAAQRPGGQQRGFGIGIPGHAEVAALGHGDQALEHVRAALGARQKRVVAQRDRRATFRDWLLVGIERIGLEHLILGEP